MRQLGSILIILGILCIAFDLAGCKSDRASLLTDWMSIWGRSTEWGIKIGMVGMGILLYFSGNRRLK
jgi:hypothetical protein